MSSSAALFYCISAFGIGYAASAVIRVFKQSVEKAGLD